MIVLLINLIGFSIICLILWWFLYSKPRSVEAKDGVVVIKVQNGVYEPSIITVKQGRDIHLRFVRYDASPCSQIVVFDKLNMGIELPMKKPVNLLIKAPNKGVYEFSCQMQMYRGKLIVE